MSFAANSLPNLVTAPVIADAPRWYAVYTYPRHEKAVAEQLESKAVETFLPIFASRSRWKDRSVEISRPLFPGYVFTRIRMEDRTKVVGIPSVVRILSFNGRPAEISAQEIESVRLCLGGGAALEAHSVPEVGERVRVCSGAFEGVEGIVANRTNRCKVIISISLIHQAVALEIDSKHLEVVESSPSSGLQPGYVHRQ
jgi:transcription antitermination factor NusG